MEEGCVRIVTTTGSNSDSEEKYEIYEAANNMFCLIGNIENKQTPIKTTGPKTRYKQSYREAWESMRDFKGWLTSVPGNSSKAYCKLCQKELHCHRLSLLKHKVTFKHQKKEEEQKLKLGVKTKKCISTERILVNKSDNGDEEEDDEEEIEEEEYEEEGEGEGEGDYEDENSGAKMETSDMEESVDETKAGSSIIHHETVQNNKSAMTSKSGPLSTHVLDLNKGIPGNGVHVVLYKLIDGRWTLIHEGSTNTDGRYDQFVSGNREFTVGRYKLHFDVDKYFADQNQDTIFPFVEIAFNVKDTSTHYHIPLLLNPYGYSTYKGS